MRCNRLAPLLIVLVACAGSDLTPGLQAAIPIGVIQTFDSLPAVTDWSSKNLPGAGGIIATATALDAAMQTNTAASINTVLVSVTAVAPGFNVQAQWSSGGRTVLTRPTGNTATILMATIQNTSGRTLSSPAIAYDMTLPSPYAGEDAELGGLRAYYSLAGLENSWTLVPELTTSNAGPKLAFLSLGSWAPDSLLYLALVDDNGGPGTDGSFAIDNFQVVQSFPVPVITNQPKSTNIIVGRTIRLSVSASGLGVSFQWFKDGLPIDPVANPTAVQSTLVITNAQLTDTGVYRAAVNNVGGGVLSNPATVNVSYDGPEPPRFLRFTRLAGSSNIFRLNVDEPLCEGAACMDGQDALFPFNWLFEEVGGARFWIAEVIPSNGTNYDFEILDFVFDPSKRYRIGPDPAGYGIADRFGGYVFMGTFITNTSVLFFKQNFEGYIGTEDIEVTPPCDPPGSCPTVTNARILVDLDNAGTESQGLLRFNDIFGYASNQIRPGARIISATLLLESTAANANGDPVNMHRMLQPWSQATATWNSFVNGIQADGIEAHTNVDATTISKLETVPFKVAVDVTTSLQSWSDGAPILGWVLLSTGSDGYRFDASELPTAPALEVVADSGVVDPPCVLLGVDLPGSLTVPEGGTFTLIGFVRSMGFCLRTFQWQKNGVNILPPVGTAGSSLFITAASVCDAGSYRLIVSSLNGLSVTSNPAIVTIPADVSRPALLRAFASPDGTNITLTFSKAMNSTNALNIAHYTLDPPLDIAGAVLSSDGRTVTLTTAPRSPLTAYTLRIQDVTDNRAACVGSIGNVISPNPTLVQLTCTRIDVPWDSEWLYSTNNQDGTLSTSTPWFAPSFTPGSDWLTGQALFGTETSAGVVAQFPTPLRTPIPPNTNSPPDQITTYFRKQVELQPLPAGATYALCHFIDDGAVFYLDGAEIGRVSMTNPPPVLFAHRASTALEAALQCFPFTAAPGSHLLAVEVHQGGATTSSDGLFGVQIEALAATPSLNIATSQPLIRWNADSIWELLTSTNLLGPFLPAAVNPSLPLGAHYGQATNPAAFFRLRYKGTAK